MLRTFSFLVFLFVFGIHSVPGQTALSSVKVVHRQYGQAYAERMVAVTGVNGVPEPKEWHVFAYDLKNPGRIAHFVVAGGKVTGAAMLDPQESKKWAAPIIPWKNVKVDSKRAFQVANGAAQAARVGFDRLAYRLVVAGTGGGALWEMELFDVSGKLVGNVKVSASTGAVIGQDWSGKPAATGAPQGGGGSNPTWGTMRTQMGKVGREIGKSFQQFRQDVGNTFKR